MKIVENALNIQRLGYSPKTYNEYLKTNHWKSRKFKKLWQVNGQCQECGDKTGLQVHHVRYKDNNGNSVLYRERMRDLIVLCDTCHKKIHGLN